MLKGNFLVAIVGRPNVGKSTVLNTLSDTKTAITSKLAGTTRDAVSATVNWRDKTFSLLDTAGKQEATTDIDREIQTQMRLVTKDADLVLFIADITTGITVEDRLLAKELRTQKIPVILTINKCDSPNQRDQSFAFLKLGLGNPFPISAIQGTGTGDLLDAIYPHIKTAKAEEEKRPLIKIAIVGKPNTGKSTLLNSLAKSKRSVVSDVPGTTRDSVDTLISWKGNDYLIIDTAGLKRKSRLKYSVEKKSAKRSTKAIRNSDICLLILDVREPITHQDRFIAREITDEKKGIILVVNKSDLSDKDPASLIHYYQRSLSYLHFAPIVFISAKKNTNTGQILKLCTEINTRRKKIVKIDKLEAILNEALSINPPSQGRGKRHPEVYKLSQIGINPPVFQLRVRQNDKLPDPWLKYITKKIREAIDFKGVPLVIRVKKVENIRKDKKEA